MDEIKLCYSFSARVDKLCFIDLLHSLHTAKRYFMRDDIIIFSTPPYSDDYEREFNKYAQVVRKPHYPIPHPTYDPNDPTPPFYWDKYYFCDVDCDNLIFLDNDTELQRDIRDYYYQKTFNNRRDEMINMVATPPPDQRQLRNLDSKFDILVFADDHRLDTKFNQIWCGTWMHLNMNVKSIVMTTAILFRNGVHRKLKDMIKKTADAYMVDKILKMPAEDRLFDEYVFAVATRNYNVQKIPKDLDMLWTNVHGSGEPFRTRRKKATILHGGSRKLFRGSNMPDMVETFDKKLLDQISVNVPLKHWIERLAATYITMLEEEYQGFNLFFSLEVPNRIVMHTNFDIPHNKLNVINAYVPAPKPIEYTFEVRPDL